MLRFDRTPNVSAPKRFAFGKTHTTSIASCVQKSKVNVLVQKDSRAEKK